MPCRLIYDDQKWDLQSCFRLMISRPSRDTCSRCFFFGCLVNDRLLKLELFEGHSVKLIYEDFQVFPHDGILSNLQKYANVISRLSVVDWADQFTYSRLFFSRFRTHRNRQLIIRLVVYLFDSQKMLNSSNSFQHSFPTRVACGSSSAKTN